MSDPNKYINYYVENSLSMVHEYINNLLQTKTQLRVFQDQIVEKDAVIASLQNEMSNHISHTEELNRTKAEATSWHDSYNSMKSKVSHMETLANQMGDAKKILVDKNTTINNLQEDVNFLKKQIIEKDSQIKELKKLVPPDLLPKKQINTKKKSTTVSEEEPKVESNTDPVAPVVEPKVKPPIIPYTPGIEGKKVSWVPPGEKAKDMVALKVVNVVEQEKETDDF